MAGLVVKALVKDGSKVEEGQPILVLEAMKMEVCTNVTCIFATNNSFFESFLS
jgi:acetyl/propionyl-CoA carboxylase alpha subunit